MQALAERQEYILARMPRFMKITIIIATCGALLSIGTSTLNGWSSGVLLASVKTIASPRVSHYDCFVSYFEHYDVGVRCVVDIGNSFCCISRL